MTDRPKTPLLDTVRSPCGPETVDRSRADHTGAMNCARRRFRRCRSRAGIWVRALGVVELTVALHAVFDAPRDKIIWDVGHQCYPHKILTERRDRIRTLRHEGRVERFHQAQSNRPMIRSARRILRRRSLRHWALPWRAIWAATPEGWAMRLP